MDNRVFRLGELAEEVEGQVFGDPELVLSSITSLELAGPEDLSFLRDPAQVAMAVASKAMALLVPVGVRVPGKSLLEVKDPALVAAQLARKFLPSVRRPAGIHPTAVIEDGAEVSPEAHVGPYVVVGGGSILEAGVDLHPGVVVGKDCQIGADSTLYPHAVLYDGTRLGPGTIIHAGAVLGSDGFGYVSRGSTHHKVPQVGRVVVEAEVEIGANAAIDRATFGETRIGAGSKIDNLVQVGHNVTIGKSCMLCGQSGIAGSARLGHGVVLAGQAGSAGHLTIGDGVQVAAKGAVLQTVEKGRKVGGIPAVELRQWQRQVFGIQKLPEILRRLRAVEKALARQEEE